MGVNVGVSVGDGVNVGVGVGVSVGDGVNVGVGVEVGVSVGDGVGVGGTTSQQPTCSNEVFEQVSYEELPGQRRATFRNEPPPYQKTSPNCTGRLKMRWIFVHIIGKVGSTPVL